MLAKINKIQHKKSGNFFLLAGPCAIEGEEMAIEIAEKIVAITNKLEIPFIFKGSYRKANRSRLDSFTGIGDIEAGCINFHPPAVPVCDSSVDDAYDTESEVSATMGSLCSASDSTATEVDETEERM